MSDSPTSKCEECGREFSSEKGLKIHKTKVHGGEKEIPKLQPGLGIRALAPLIIVILVIVAAFLLLNYYSAVSEEEKVGKEAIKNVETQSVTIFVLPENETVNGTAPG